MDSVTFEDVSTLKKIKKAKRREIVALMEAYPNWYKTDNSVARKIRQLGKEIDGETMDVSRPIKTIDADQLTVKEYIFLRKLGYRDNTLRRAAGMSKAMWNNYKKRTYVERKRGSSMLEIYHTSTTALVADESTRSYRYVTMADAKTVAKGMQTKMTPWKQLSTIEERLKRAGYVKQEKGGKK